MTRQRTFKVVVALSFWLATVMGAQASFNVDPGAGPGGLMEAKLFSAWLSLHEDAGEVVEYIDTGVVRVWNTRDHLQLRVRALPPLAEVQQDPVYAHLEWKIRAVDVFVGDDSVPTLEAVDLDGLVLPDVSLFPYRAVYGEPITEYRLELPFAGAMQFAWGEPWRERRKQNISVHAVMVQLDETGRIVNQKDLWTFNPRFEAQDPQWETVVVGANTVHERGVRVKARSDLANGRTLELQTGVLSSMLERHWDYFTYEMAHPRRAQFIDSPVEGLSYRGPTQAGTTDASGGFDYFPGESVELALGPLWLGAPYADQKISPLDVFPEADTGDARVIQMARLLQSLDVDGEPRGGIRIDANVRGCLEDALLGLGRWDGVAELAALDWSDAAQVEEVIEATHDQCQGVDGVNLVAVTAEDAQAHLEETLSNAMFRKRVSRTPEYASSKAKMNVASVWLPALKANGEPAAVDYFDEDGDLIRTATEAKPLIVTYTDADPLTGAHDVWAAVSRDDGHTWKRQNLSRSADRSSFTLANGLPYYGACKKPVFQVKGNKIVVAWSSKFAHGGKPRYAIAADDPSTPDVDEGDGYSYDDPYAVDDIWGVGGPQRSHDYTEDGFPEVGEVPYSAVWVCRGIIATQADVDKGVAESAGDIVWFKPERLTSGRRDANQIFIGAAGGAGFALVWQEDPEGLRPGRAVGPGPGWGGATTHHKTDIWYSYLGWGDHTKVDTHFVPGGDPEHDLDDTRPKALVPLSLPLRLSDNDVLNQKNMGIDDTSYADALAYTEESLTRCVKFEGGKTIVEPDSPEAASADYPVLRAVPADHLSSMNCTNCHAAADTEPVGSNPLQGAPVPLVVIDAGANDYLGSFTNGDCVSCHFSHSVPRDRLIAVTPGLDEADKCAECEAKGGVWKDGTQEGGEVVEAYYPYTGYPYLFDDGSLNDGTHRYGLAVPGLLSGEYYTFTNYAGNETSVAITTDGRLLDGDTGASRANIFLQPYTFTKPDGSTGTSAWAIITYEETKGAGAGPPDTDSDHEAAEDGTGSGVDAYLPESGKNVIYHSFDFKNPDRVAAGNIMNPPEMDIDGNPVYLVDENGVEILDYLGRPQLAYENARRGRFILQGIGAVRASRTVMLMVMKMGEEGAGRPSDIFMRRWVIPENEITFKYKDGKIAGVTSVEGNPYRFENIVGEYVQDPLSHQGYWASGPVNMSSVTPTVTTDSLGDPEVEDPYGAVKVVEWTQTVDNLVDASWTNPYDDARAHRGQIRGDFVALGFSYTPNWAAARNGNDKYDFFIRRSFDGGATWTTKPGGEGVEHCYTWTDPETKDKTEECTTYPAGTFEAMRNLTQLPNHKASVIEPRIVAVPGTIKAAGTWTGIAEDKQDPRVFYVAWGTSSNPKKDPETGLQDEPVPMDLYYSFSRDQGENYFVDEWTVNPDSDGNFAGETVAGTPWLAKGDPEQGEVQLRMTPDGSRFYASWLEEGLEGSDIVFRRIMPAEFPANLADAATTEALPVAEEAGAEEDFSSDSGGDED